MIGAIFAILGFLVGIWGVAIFLLGVVGFLLFPMISTASRWKGPANAFLKLATFPMRRAAIVISEHNDAIFKSMKFLGIGVEQITIDGEEKLFEDPDDSLHYFLGMKFGFANEKHGVLFDPRHAALGMKKRVLKAHNDDTYLATEDEWQEYGVAKWIPGVFEMPTKHEIVDLSAVRELVDGGERSEYARRVEELYKHSRDPFNDSKPIMKFLYPVISLAIGFFGVWFMMSQFGLPGGNPSSTVSYNAVGPLLLSLSGLSSSRVREFLGKLDKRLWAGLFLAVTVPLGTIVGLTLVFNVVLTIAILVAFTLGFIFLPILTFLSKPSKILSELFSKLYFKLGFFGYRQPVITWTPEKYVVKEHDELETTDNVEWYDLFGHVIGVSYYPQKAWGPEQMSHQQIEAEQAVADGGEITDTNLPPKYVRSSQIRRDSYGGYLPKRISDRKQYVDTGIALERFKHSADGEKSLKKLLEAKDEHGSPGDGIDNNMVFKTSTVTGLIGLFLGIGIFVVPAFI